MKRMTLDEIKKAYPEEWVLIAHPETDDGLHLLGGIVLTHSKPRDEEYEALKRCSGHHAVRFTGELQGIVFVL